MHYCRAPMEPLFFLYFFTSLSRPCGPQTIQSTFRSLTPPVLQGHYLNLGDSIKMIHLWLPTIQASPPKKNKFMQDVAVKLFVVFEGESFPSVLWPDIPAVAFLPKEKPLTADGRWENASWLPALFPNVCAILHWCHCSYDEKWQDHSHSVAQQDSLWVCHRLNKVLFGFNLCIMQKGKITVFFLLG